MATKRKAGLPKESIRPPTPKELKDASKELRKGHSSGGRTMVANAVAIKQGVAERTAKRSKKR